ncbi:MAG: SMC-Scp complex subunit ScpB, partial [Deltaproteobacteria bacterium]|nr:SMC-Scp complex subunit ScpB [Deltaproteobacteria bacterium]
MSKKRGRSKQQPVQVQAIPEEVLAEGSGPLADDVPSIEVSPGVEGMPIAGIQPAERVGPELEARSAELTAQGDGELAAQGDGELAAQSDGELAAQTDGELAAQSDGELAAQSDGELAASGDGELAAQGDGEASAHADGEIEGDAEVEAAAMPTSAASMDSVQLKQLVEALVFASDKPITVQRLRQLTRVSDVARLEQTLTEIAADYAERGLILQQVSGGFQFRTRPQFSVWVQQLIAGRPVRLSRAQLETLAIIAYRQPITRPE